MTCLIESGESRVKPCYNVISSYEGRMGKVADLQVEDAVDFSNRFECYERQLSSEDAELTCSGFIQK